MCMGCTFNYYRVKCRNYSWLNIVMFPYFVSRSHPNSHPDLIFIYPPDAGWKMEKTKIPAIYIKRGEGKSKNGIILYSHGNGDTLGSTYPVLKSLSDGLDMDAIAYEYPHYGLFRSNSDSRIFKPKWSTEATVISAAVIAYDYVVNYLKYEPKKILIWGYSIGTGPSSFLAWENRLLPLLINDETKVENYEETYREKCGAIVLQSGFCSIRELAKSMAGPFFGSMMMDRFENIKWMSGYQKQDNSDKYPGFPGAFFLHGERDGLISFDHSRRMYLSCKNTNKRVHIAKGVGHASFNIESDMIKPVRDWLNTFFYDKEEELETSSSFSDTGASLPRFHKYHTTEDICNKVELPSSYILNKELTIMMKHLTSLSFTDDNFQ